MITYGQLGAIYPTKYYYVLQNEKKEAICYMKAEEKKDHEELVNRLGFELRLGKEFM